ncbi:MAG: transposase [Desulfobacteraceae bacterium]|nr:transposase [Desulfobacteraceae bacterium]
MKLGYDVHERTISEIIKRLRPRNPPSQTWRTFLKNHMFNTFAVDLFVVVERLIGSIRRDCINAMIVLNEAHLRHILTECLAYYHEDRTHLGLGKETPGGRSVSEKPENGKVVALPRLGGLHHRYEWRDAA